VDASATRLYNLVLCGCVCYTFVQLSPVWMRLLHVCTTLVSHSQTASSPPLFLVTSTCAMQKWRQEGVWLRETIYNLAQHKTSNLQKWLGMVALLGLRDALHSGQRLLLCRAVAMHWPLQRTKKGLASYASFLLLLAPITPLSLPSSLSPSLLHPYPSSLSLPSSLPLPSQARTRSCVRTQCCGALSGSENKLG